MADREHPGLPVSRQGELLDLLRSTFCHVTEPFTDAALESMMLMDRCSLQLPFYGSCRIRGCLADQGYQGSRKRVQRLMRKIGIAAMCPKQLDRTNCFGFSEKIPIGFYEFVMTHLRSNGNKSVF